MIRTPHVTATLVLTVFTLNACNSAGGDVIATTVPTSITTVTEQPTEQVSTEAPTEALPAMRPSNTEAVDWGCGYEATVIAWLDLDTDGEKDSGEPPMEDMTFYLRHRVISRFDDALEATTDSEGIAHFTFFPAGCEGTFNLYPEWGGPYQLTTLPNDGVMKQGKDVFYFGFTELSDYMTADQLSLTCTTFPEINDYDIQSLAVEADGTLWSGTYNNGVTEFDPTTQTWTSYPNDDGIRDTEVAPNGTIWFGTEVGLTRFDGSIWTSYQPDESPYDVNTIYAFEIAPDGMMWVVGYAMIGSFEPKSQSWTIYTFKDHAMDEDVKFWEVMLAQDGSIWFTTSYEGVLRLQFPTNDPAEPHWTFYNDHPNDFIDPQANIDAKPTPITGIDSMLQAADGTLWLAATFGLLVFDPSTGAILHEYSPVSGAIDMVVGPDGAIWMGTGGGGVVRFLPDEDLALPGEWSYYGTRDGLLGDYVRQVIFQSADTVWFVSQPEGLTQCIFP